MMGKNFYLMMVLVAVSGVFAGYTYEVEMGDSGSVDLFGHESLLMTGGEMTYFSLHDYSSAHIEGTDPLISQGNGGIWDLWQGGNSNVEILGGEIHEITFATSTRGTGNNLKISGGRIDILSNFQEIDPAKNIEIICRDWLYNVNTKKLTGTWEDFSTFDIQLVNVAGYEPTIDNILFTIVPEPMSLLLLGVGAIATRWKK
ncbi:MAG: PEP-CTERM sorting domain-containing protein [Anaerohalosphaera sp.]|nr:PEP-CTERM sorting domain-containing protein [Anaerohalosphaera sp.]